MCIKRRHGNGCMWPSHEGYSPAIVVAATELYTRWVTRIFTFSLSFTHFSNFIPPIVHSFVNWNPKTRRVYLPTHADTTSLDLQGPIFVHEPAYKVEFSNNTGGHVHCSGHASPYPEVIHWKFLFLLTTLPTLMMQSSRVLHNATMNITFLPFPSWLFFRPRSYNQIKRGEKKSLIKLICWNRDGYKFIPIWEASSFIVLFCIPGFVCWKYIELQFGTFFLSPHSFFSRSHYKMLLKLNQIPYNIRTQKYVL